MKRTITRFSNGRALVRSMRSGRVLLIYANSVEQGRILYRRYRNWSGVISQKRDGSINEFGQSNW